MILKKKLKNAYVNKELKEKRENINDIIENRKNKNSLMKSGLKLGENEKDREIEIERECDIVTSNNEEYEKIKREKAEKEYYKLLDEIKDAMEEVKIDLYKNYDIKII
jgi:hypothetical protein